MHQMRFAAAIRAAKSRGDHTGPRHGPQAGGPAVLIKPLADTVPDFPYTPLGIQIVHVPVGTARAPQMMTDSGGKTARPEGMAGIGIPTRREIKCPQLPDR